MSLVNAELTKIAVNTYVTMKISYANALADMCERLPGADVEAVTDALGLDTRIGTKYLRGAIAYGGPCFPRDNKAFGVLARDLGAEPLLAEATDAVNVAQTDRLARVVQSRLEPGSAVGILGLAYKPHTGVVEESPGVALARLLASAGYEVRVYDPVATEAALARWAELARGCASAAELLEQSDVVVIATPWPEFAELPLDALEREGRRTVVIDCWRLLPEEADDGAVEIVRLGRPLEEPSPVTRGGDCRDHLADRPDSRRAAPAASSAAGSCATCRRTASRSLRAVDIKPLDEWHQVIPDVDNRVADLRALEACRDAVSGIAHVYNLACDMGGMGFIEANRAACMISVLINTHLLIAGRDEGVKRHFYSSSACVYNVDLQQRLRRDRPARGGRLSGAARGRLRLGEALLGAHVPELPRRLRHRDARRPLPQRLRAARDVRRRPREGAGGDLPQGRRGEAHRPSTRSRSGETASRRAASCTSTIASRDDADHGERHPRADQPRLLRARDDQPARRHRRGDRRREARSGGTTSTRRRAFAGATRTTRSSSSASAGSRASRFRSAWRRRTPGSTTS